MKISVYGTGGCASCKILYNRVKGILASNAIDADLKYITDIKIAIDKGIMQMPALEVDNKIVSMGKIAKEKDILKYLGR